MGPSEGNNVTYPSQQLFAAEPSTAATQVDPTLSSHHSSHSSAAGLFGANAKDDSKMKKLEEKTETGEVDGVRTAGDGGKGSEDRIPPAKLSKAVKSAKQPRCHQTYLVPGINTEKHPYGAEDEDEDHISI